MDLSYFLEVFTKRAILILLFIVIVLLFIFGIASIGGDKIFGIPNIIPQKTGVGINLVAYAYLLLFVVELPIIYY